MTKKEIIWRRKPDRNEVDVYRDGVKVATLTEPKDMDIFERSIEGFFDGFFEPSPRTGYPCVECGKMVPGNLAIRCAKCFEYVCAFCRDTHKCH